MPPKTLAQKLQRIKADYDAGNIDDEERDMLEKSARRKAGAAEPQPPTATNSKAAKAGAAAAAAASEEKDYLDHVVEDIDGTKEDEFAAVQKQRDNSRMVTKPKEAPELFDVPGLSKELKRSMAKSIVISNKIRLGEVGDVDLSKYEDYENIENFAKPGSYKPVEEEIIITEYNLPIVWNNYLQGDRTIREGVPVIEDWDRDYETEHYDKMLKHDHELQMKGEMYVDLENLSPAHDMNENMPKPRAGWYFIEVNYINA